MQDATLAQPGRSEPDVRVATHCPYCALQCGMYVTVSSQTQSGQDVSITGNSAFPVNKGGLCIKGWTAAATLRHSERLLGPLARDEAGSLVPVSWDEALTRIVETFAAVQGRYGRDALGIFGGGSLTNEKAYLLGKFARVALGTSQIDYNGRFCMSSAAAASTKAFGVDRGLPFPLEDIGHAELILLVGSNVAETMPPLMRYFEAQRANGGQLILVDPRASTTAQSATLHLRLTPGSDIALANGLLHLLLSAEALDLEYIMARTEGFEQVRGVAAAYWPERVERLTGVPQSLLIQAAHMLARARSILILTARGPEQQAQGVNNVLAYINLALALGLVGRPGSGYGCLTGQGNGQGGREHGQKADQLPGYRKINDAVARRHVAAVWGVPEQELPGPGRSAYELLESLGQANGVRALLVMGSNIAVSAPRSLYVQERLRALDFLVVSDMFLSETAELADVVLPTAQWAEEEGTMTNLEGRVILRRRALAPPGEVHTDIEVLCELAARLGKRRFFDYADSGAIFEELRRATSGGPADYAGITYERIAEQQGIFWPCPDEEHPGTPRLFAHSFPTATGRARFHPVQQQLPAEERDGEYPLYLTTGRVLAHYQSGTQTRRVAQLQAQAPGPEVEIHPLTAKRYGLSEGATARLTSRRGSALFRVKLTTTMREDTVFAPFHWGGEQAVNNLTNPALDPVSRMPEFKVCAVRVEPLSPAEEVGV